MRTSLHETLRQYVAAEWSWIANDCRDYLAAMERGGILAVVQLLGFKFTFCNETSEQFASKVHSEIFGQVSS